ncbi:unnamed protein product [Brassica rapa subsp. trilocularis]
MHYVAVKTPFFLPKKKKNHATLVKYQSQHIFGKVVCRFQKQNQLGSS